MNFLWLVAHERYGGVLKIDLKMPARIVQGLDVDAVLVLPVSIALSGVPSHEPCPDSRRFLVICIAHLAIMAHRIDYWSCRPGVMGQSVTDCPELLLPA
jgi:hypothetical protein